MHSKFKFINQPSVHFSFMEFADFMVLISLCKAKKLKSSIINQTRIYWKIGPMNIQKGLIKLLKNTDINDIYEIIQFTRDWCNAVRKNDGNVQFPNKQEFEICLFSDSITLGALSKQVWKLTSKRIESGFELHAFDLQDDEKTYWCPEYSKVLSEKLLIDETWINGSFPKEKNLRDKLLIKHAYEYLNI